MALPDNRMGRTLAAQDYIWETLQKAAVHLDTDEARNEVKRIGRFLGYVEKTKRGPRKTTAQ